MVGGNGDVDCVSRGGVAIAFMLALVIVGGGEGG